MDGVLAPSVPIPFRYRSDTVPIPFRFRSVSVPKVRSNNKPKPLLAAEDEWRNTKSGHGGRVEYGSRFTLALGPFSAAAPKSLNLYFAAAERRMARAHWNKEAKVEECARPLRGSL
jgi:hypothetical protein